jgi:hypothetical protein
MDRKIWQAEAVKTHLLAVQKGMWASIPPSLRRQRDERFVAYESGCKAVLKYLGERFGISQNGTKPAGKPQTGELRLRTWNREDVRSILEETWAVVYDTNLIVPEQGVLSKAYYYGVKKTIFAIARSFGIKDFVLDRAK